MWRLSSFRRWLRASTLVVVACVGSVLLFHDTETSAWDTAGNDRQHDGPPVDGGKASHDGGGWLRNGWHDIESDQETCNMVLAAHGTTRNGLKVDIPDNFRVRNCIDHYECRGSSVFPLGTSEWRENHRHHLSGGVTSDHDRNYRVSLDGVTQADGVTVDKLTCGDDDDDTTVPPPPTTTVSPPGACAGANSYFDTVSFTISGTREYPLSPPSQLRFEKYRSRFGSDPFTLVDVSWGRPVGQGNCEYLGARVDYRAFRLAESVDVSIVDDNISQSVWLQQVHPNLQRAGLRTYANDDRSVSDMPAQGRQFVHVRIYPILLHPNLPITYTGIPMNFYSEMLCPDDSQKPHQFSGLHYPEFEERTRDRDRPFVHEANDWRWIAYDTVLPSEKWAEDYRSNCSTTFTPDVTIEVPDGYRAHTFEVTFTRQSGSGTCPTKTATYTPAANPGHTATLITGDPLLDGACVYTVDYENPAADGDLELDPTAAGHDIKVTADDPATKATYTEATFGPAAATTHAVASTRPQVA